MSLQSPLDTRVFVVEAWLLSQVLPMWFLPEVLESLSQLCYPPGYCKAPQSCDSCVL